MTLAESYVLAHWDDHNVDLAHDAGIAECTVRRIRNRLMAQNPNLTPGPHRRVTTPPVPEATADVSPETPTETRNRALEERFVQDVAASITRLPEIQHDSLFTPVSRNRDEELCVELSDLHIGEVVDPVATGGLGAYNYGIFEQRLNVLVSEIERTARGGSYSRINWFILGDIVDGYDIYKGQAHHQDRVITDQTVLGARKVAIAISYLSQFFEESVCYCVVGNHGRIGRKGEAPVRASFDYLSYVMMREFLGDNKSVRFHIADSWFQVVERGDSRFILLHGDDIHAWNSIPYYGMERAERRYAKLTGMDTDFLCVGHFHTPVQTTSVLANGSFVGPTEFAKVIQAGSLPTQKMFAVSKTDGLLWVRDVALTTWNALRKIDVLRD